MGLRIEHCQFSKVNAERKGRPGVSSQEETHVKLSRAKGNIKTVLVSGGVWAEN